MSDKLIPDVPPPTPEQWARAPWLLRVKVVTIVLYYTWRRWTWEGWLRWACGKSRQGIK